MKQDKKYWNFKRLSALLFLLIAVSFVFLRINRNMFLWCATAMDSPLLVKTSLTMGADVNMVNEENYLTPLQVATIKSNPETIRFLLAADADLNLPYESLPLLFANTSENHEILELLFEAGADINSREDRCDTLLMKAAASGSYQHVTWLLIHGADPEIHNSRGFTALMIATLHGNYKQAQALLAYGADPNFTNKSGETALYFAHDNRRGNLKELIKNAQAADNPDVGVIATLPNLPNPAAHHRD